jgi:hypothetical protein
MRSLGVRSWAIVIGTAAVLIAVVFAGISSRPPSNELPRGARTILDEADEFELYSLDPWGREPEGFHGWKILGKTAVKDGTSRRSIIDALERGISENHGAVAMCFNPRHGVRAIRGD